MAVDIRKNSQQIALDDFIYFGNTQGDVIDNLRLSNASGALKIQKCTVAHATKGSGTWEDIDIAGVGAFDPNSIGKIFNVKSYGALGDNTNDDTVAIQAAITACDNAGGGTVYFPNGIYKVSGALNATYGNCQIYIPDRSANDPAQTGITLLGESCPNIYANGCAGQLTPTAVLQTGGVIIRSTITGSGTRPAVFGGIGNVTQLWGYWIYRTINFKNLNIRVEPGIATGGPSMSCINGEHYAKFIGENLTLGQDIVTYSTVQPTNESAGIIFALTNDEINILRNVNSSGFKYGIVCGEHVILDTVWCFANANGIAFANNGYSVWANILVLVWNEVNILIPNAAIMGDLTCSSTFLNINNLELETYTGGLWFAFIADIVDEGNKAKGIINYKKSVSIVKTGANNININNLAELKTVYYESLTDSNQTEASGSYIDLPTGKSGRGIIVFGKYSASFNFDTDGSVELIESSDNIFMSLQTGTNHVIIKDNGSNVRIVNEMGATTVFNVKIYYTN